MRGDHTRLRRLERRQQVYWKGSRMPVTVRRLPYRFISAGAGLCPFVELRCHHRPLREQVATQKANVVTGPNCLERDLIASSVTGANLESVTRSSGFHVGSRRGWDASGMRIAPRPAGALLAFRPGSTFQRSRRERKSEDAIAKILNRQSLTLLTRKIQAMLADIA